MSFIRAKEIPPRSGNWYDYEVKCVWNNGHPLQKVIQYLGKSTLRGSRPAFSHGDIGVVARSTIISTKPATITKMKTSSHQIASALGMYYGGMSLDAIKQQFKQDYDLEMSESNYWNWVKRFTKEAINQSKDFHPEVGDTWVADETYMKLGDETVYFLDIIDSKTSVVSHKWPYNEQVYRG